ncbi:Uncharacterised protein [Pseudomonas fluorescens]|uniref:Uncharacterized protein n=1 Tax=Pseudomonas fluorescens TaxID=294 RepID=A0A3S4R7P2_PSEFL|nr:Uncharacterised protein [Pseudomonas fluorescens]
MILKKLPKPGVKVDKHQKAILPMIQNALPKLGVKAGKRQVEILPTTQSVLQKRVKRAAKLATEVGVSPTMLAPPVALKEAVAVVILLMTLRKHRKRERKVDKIATAEEINRNAV